ncbi:Signal transduction histidine kinase [Kaistia soli DSM 19436]|uniref:histidine kinase n=1 Tax=Kaistia soli DSM 19436 TaxID=1122133 RepID=A0A1M4YY54_9HYPH|nr:hybrid sensor histidine kinase/response regulator [Kaistia soli]SHF10487.1 Signal transduction histidine kinase [Kaistia soli DSM 19436]
MPFSTAKQLRLNLDVTRLVALMGMLGILLTLATTAYLAQREYQQRFRDAKNELVTEAFFLSDHANRLFEVAMIALSSARSLAAGRSWDDIANNPQLARQFRDLASAIPYIEDVWLNDSTGQLRATSFAFPAPKSDASDRENFKASQLPVDELFVGPLIRGKVTRRPTFLLSNRMQTADGGFNGMVSVTADLAYFSDYWQGVALPYDARVTITRVPTLEVLAEFPERSERPATPEGLGKSVAYAPGDGEYASEGPNGRFGAFRKVGDHPIYLTVDISDAAVVAGWKSWLANILPVPAIAIALFGVLSWLAIRDSRMRHASQLSLAAANEGLLVEMKRRESAEDQLRQLQKIEAIGQLTGGIAHDFNNMLAIIVGSLGLMEKRLKRGERDIEKYLTSAQEGASRAAALTQRLLAFARKQPLAPQTIDPNRFVAGMSDLLQRTLTESIRIETVLAAGLWKVRVDPAQLENALLNLSVNARDAMPQGGRLTIETANASIDPAYSAANGDVPAGQYAMIAVTDTGTGMPPEIIKRVFEPFFTTKGIGKGSGLGLSQVYGFVRQSGGQVTIYSELGQGSTVKIYLPRHYGVDAEFDKDQPAVDGRPTGSPDEVILVVEDEAGVRQLSVEALRDLGYTVIDASGAGRALELIETNSRIDLLFTDIIMPDINGRELADRARALRPLMKVLYTTGYTRNAVVHNGLLDPGVRLLGKPFSIDQLAASVRAALDS